MPLWVQFSLWTSWNSGPVCRNILWSLWPLRAPAVVTNVSFWGDTWVLYDVTALSKWFICARCVLTYGHLVVAYVDCATASHTEFWLICYPHYTSCDVHVQTACCPIWQVYQLPRFHIPQRGEIATITDDSFVETVVRLCACSVSLSCRSFGSSLP